MKKTRLVAIFYIIVSGMLVYPLPVSQGPFIKQLMGFYLFLMSHLFIAYICSLGLFKSYRAFVCTFFLCTAIGIFLRYILEYGEASWTRIFTVEKLVIYMLLSTSVSSLLFVVFQKLQHR